MEELWYLHHYLLFLLLAMKCQPLHSQTVVSPLATIALQGQNVIISCKFSNRSGKDAQIWWYQKGTLRGYPSQLSNGSSYRILKRLEAGESELTILNASLSSSGNYRCAIGRVS